MTPRELRDEQRGRTRVDDELLVNGLGGDSELGMTEPIGGVGRKRIGDPAGGVVDQDVHCTKRLFGRVEQPRGRSSVREVGFESDGTPALCLDGREHRSGVEGPVPTIQLRNRGIARIRDTQIRNDDGRAAGGEQSRRRGADAMVRACDQHNVVL